MMRTLYRRDLSDDRGSIILALLGIVILTTVASVGLAAVVNGQHQSRHDNTFSTALNNAESGVDAMVATIKSTDNYNSPSKALSQSPQLNSNLTLTGGESGSYSVTASPKNNLGSTGDVASTVWTIKSTGKALIPGTHTYITRTVTEVVTIAHTYNAPIEGRNSLSLPPGSGVTEYTAANTVTGVASQQVIGTGLNLSGLGLGTLGGTTVKGLPEGTAANPTTPGAAQTQGTLSVSPSDLANFNSIALDNGESCATATGSSSMCSSSTFVTQQNPAPPITQSGCTSGVGASLNGQPLVNVPVFGLVLNANIDAQLLAGSNSGATLQTVCTNLPIVIPTIGTNIGSDLSALGLTGLDGLTSGLGGTLDVPVGSSCTDLTAGGAVTTLTSALITHNLSCTMDNPSQLVLNEVPTYTTVNGVQQCNANPVYLGTGTSVPTYTSAIITNPCGTCYINGNVVLLGAINCASIVYESSSDSLQVYYPTDENLPYANTEHQDSVSSWNETHAD